MKEIKGYAHPLCNQCGKRLPKVYRSLGAGISKEPVLGEPWNAGTVWKLICGYKPTKPIRRDPGIRAQYRQYWDIWLGEFGLRGKGKFCTGTCAVRWAHQHAEVRTGPGGKR